MILVNYLECHHLSPKEDQLNYQENDTKSHTKVISNQVQGLRVIRDLIIQTSEVKPIKDKIFINFTKVFIAFRREEPRDPLE